MQTFTRLSDFLTVTFFLVVTVLGISFCFLLAGGIVHDNSKNRYTSPEIGSVYTTILSNIEHMVMKY